MPQPSAPACCRGGSSSSSCSIAAIRAVGPGTCSPLFVRALLAAVGGGGGCFLCDGARRIDSDDPRPPAGGGHHALHDMQLQGRIDCNLRWIMAPADAAAMCRPASTWPGHERAVLGTSAQSRCLLVLAAVRRRACHIYSNIIGVLTARCSCGRTSFWNDPVFQDLGTGKYILA